MNPWPFWAGILVGLMVGTCFGALCMAAMAAASQADDQWDELMRRTRAPQPRRIRFKARVTLRQGRPMRYALGDDGAAS
ncbi:MAG: hypothetical protein ABI665_28435 [Vicinamibacterales bacterium]